MIQICPSVQTQRPEDVRREVGKLRPFPVSSVAPPDTLGHAAYEQGNITSVPYYKRSI
jgi:hypothetical protein